MPTTTRKESATQQHMKIGSRVFVIYSGTGINEDPFDGIYGGTVRKMPLGDNHGNSFIIIDYNDGSTGAMETYNTFFTEKVIHSSNPCLPRAPITTTKHNDPPTAPSSPPRDAPLS